MARALFYPVHFTHRPSGCVLGERLTPVGAVGVLLVILGVVLSDGHYPRLHRRKEQHEVG